MRPTFLTIVFLAIIPFSTASAKTASSVSGSNIPSYSEQGCQNQPSCSECGGYSCSAHAGYCGTSYVAFPTSPFKRALIPFQTSYSDVSCTYLSTTCTGGTTNCRIDQVPVVSDYIADLSPAGYVQNTNTATCNYLHATCLDCCTSWVSQCYSYHTCYDTVCDNANPPNCSQTNPHNCC